MKLSYDWVHCIAVILLFSASASSTACAATVTVNVSVRTETGVPLESVPLEIVSPTQARFAMTNASGNVTVELDTATENELLTAWLSPGYRYDLTADEQLLASTKYDEYVDAYFFDRYYMTDLIPGVTEYDMAVTAYDAVDVTGRVMNQLTWADDVVLVDSRGSRSSRLLKYQEPFTARVRKGQPGELFIMFDGHAVHSLLLTASQTTADVALGDITLPSINYDEPVTISLLNGTDVYGPGGVQKLWTGVTLIRSDGSIMFSFPVTSDGLVVKNAGTAGALEAPQIPAGLYYIAPGRFDRPMQNKLLDKIRAGELLDLEAHNVPKVIAPGTISFDVAQARDAIIAASEGMP